jgi:hypothetical protein
MQPHVSDIPRPPEAVMLDPIKICKILAKYNINLYDASN